MQKFMVKGKGITTNVPEEALIKEVRQRPLLYDKNVKEYRIPASSEAAWIDISRVLRLSAINCRKRWKSLRDTFIKYYRLELNNAKSKQWRYYNLMSFLKPHVDLFRTEQQSSITQKEDVIEIQHFDNEKHFFLAEESVDGDEVRYQIKIDDHESEEEELIESIVDEPKETEKSEYAVEEEPQSVTEPTNEAPQRTITDPDERYLLSCLPAFKRLTPRQKAQVRIGIEKLFFEVEFECEPATKKFKDR